MNNTEFIKSVKLNGSVPENQLQFDDQTILDLATEEMDERMVPFMSAINSGYMEYPLTIPLQSGISGYRVSSRVLYGGIKDVWISSGTGIYPLIPMNETLKDNATGNPQYYYFSGPYVCVYPTPTVTSLSLNLKVRLRQSKMTVYTNHGQITAIDTSLNTVTLASIPVTLTAGADVDFQEATPIHDICQIQNKITTLDTLTNVATMRDALPTDLSVGDFICPAATCAFPPIPQELHSTLALMTASRCLGALGQLDQKAAIDKRIDENLGRLRVSMWPRGRGENEKIVSPYL